MKPTRVAIVACLAIFACLAGSAHAEGEAEFAAAVAEALVSGDVAGAADRLAAGSRPPGLVSQPALVHRVCAAATRGRDRLARADADSHRRLARTLQGLAEDALEARPTDPESRWALAHAFAATERTRESALAGAWDRAADLLEGVYEEAPTGGRPLADAVSLLLEGACRVSADAHALTKRAAAVSARAVRAHPGSGQLAIALADAQFRTARLLVGARRKEAKAALKACFDHLRPYPGPHRRLGTVWNDAVSFDRTAGFVLREKYRTVSDTALGGRVSFEVPVSYWWSVGTGGDADADATFKYVSQVMADGTPRRQVLFRSYDWSRRYALDGPNEINGDNVKNLAKSMRDLSATNLFRAGATLGKVRKGRVNESFDGYTFEIRGQDIRDGRPLRLRGCYVRGKKQMTYAVLTYDFTEDGAPEPAMEAFLESIREVDD